MNEHQEETDSMRANFEQFHDHFPYQFNRHLTRHDCYDHMETEDAWNSFKLGWHLALEYAFNQEAKKHNEEAKKIEAEKINGL